MYNDRSNAIRGQVVKLQIQYLDVNEEPIEPDAIPEVRIVDSLGGIILDYTDEGVFRIEKGLYQILFEAPSDGNIGMWMDEWRAQIGEQPLDTIFIFSVVMSLNKITKLRRLVVNSAI